MFAKTLVIFAAAAMTAAEARKLQVSPRDLIDIDFDNLDVRDIKDIVHEYKDQINDWAFEFGKNCPSEEVCERRSANWLRTEAFIQKFNADPSRSASVGHNRFSDLSKAEMDQILNARSVDENEDALRSRNLDDDSSADSDSDSDSEESFSDNDDDDNQERLLRGKPCKKNCEEPPTGCAAQSEKLWGNSVVHPIKDQGQCGSCYAFSAVAVLESAYAIKNSSLVTLSEQKIVDCYDQTFNSYYGVSCCYGCDGGYIQMVLDAAKDSDYAIVKDSDYPYTGRESTCQSPVSDVNVVVDEVFTIAPKRPNDVKAALCEAPIQISVQAEGSFMFYSSGVMTSRDCRYRQADHTVTVIGWTQVNGQEAFVVKNSWGTSWGDDGYIYLANDNGNKKYGPCGMFHWPSYATIQ